MSEVAEGHEPGRCGLGPWETLYLPTMAVFSEGMSITDNVPFATLLITLAPKGIVERNTGLKFRANVPFNHIKIHVQSFFRQMSLFELIWVTSIYVFSLLPTLQTTCTAINIYFRKLKVIKTSYEPLINQQGTRF